MPRRRIEPLSAEEQAEIQAWIERHWGDLEPQITRESGYWARKKFPRRCSRSQEDLREDLYQEACEILVRVARAYNAGHISQAKPGTYLTTAIRNRFKDLLDKEMKSIPVSYAFDRDNDDSWEPSTPAVADLIAQFRSLTSKELEWAEAFAEENGSPKRTAKRKGTTVTIANRIQGRLGEKL